MRLACAVLVAMVVATTTTGGRDGLGGNMEPRSQGVGGALPVLRVVDRLAIPQRSGDGGVDAHGRSPRVRIQGLASDGIATPGPVVNAPAELATPTPETATQVPVETRPHWNPDVERWRWLVATVFAGSSSNQVDYILDIMQCESKGRPGATGAAGERGLMQIHPVHYDSTYDPEGNLRAAYRISNGGRDWSAWTCA